jgi:hypothetical protein
MKTFMSRTIVRRQEAMAASGTSDHARICAERLLRICYGDFGEEPDGGN